MIVTASVMLTAMQAVKAADKKLVLPIAAAMAENAAQERLGDSVRFYFAGQDNPVVIKKLGEDVTSQRTSAFGKSDEMACNWVFVSAMLALKKQAEALGANAVIHISGNFKDPGVVSPAGFECRIGTVMAGVAFKADFVVVEKK